MKEINSPYELSISTDEDCEYISDEVMHFNARAVPFTQKENPVFKRYVLKDNNAIIAGINAVIYHWGMLYIDELFVSEDYRHKQLGLISWTRLSSRLKSWVPPYLIWTRLTFKRKIFI
jgi:hypothetical protein